MWMKRRSGRLPVYCTRFSMAPLFFLNNSKQFELNTGEPSRCYSAKISTVSRLWKGHQVEKMVGTFKTNPRFPPPELYWTSTLRSLLFDSDNKNVQEKCAINKPSITKINDPRSIPHSNTISPFRNEQKLPPLSCPQQASLGTSSASNKFLHKSLKISYKMFSFSRSGRDPTLPQAGKCPSVPHVRPSRGSGCHSQGTGAGSPRCTPSRYPDPRRKNPPPRHHHLAPHRAVTPDPAQTRRWNQTGWRSQKQEQAGLIGCCQWMRSTGSSSSGTSEVSAQRSKKKKKKMEMSICIAGPVLPSS